MSKARRVGRRQFLVGACGAAAGTVLGTVATSDADATGLERTNPLHGPDAVTGPVLMVSTPRALTIAGPDEPIKVITSASTYVWRGGEVSLSDFTPNDQIVATGRWAGKTTFRATTLTIALVGLQGSATRVASDRLESDDWVVTVVPETRIQRGARVEEFSADAIDVGSRVSVLALQDPDRGYLAQQIFTEDA